MPTVLLINGYRFFFFSNEGDEPIHIHVKRADGEGKIWLLPSIRPAFFINFKESEKREIMALTTEHHHHFIQQWHEYFKAH
jgi:hypothetical protein